jgi:tRNA_anti-like
MATHHHLIRLAVLVIAAGIGIVSGCYRRPSPPAPVTSGGLTLEILVGDDMPRHFGGVFVGDTVAVVAECIGRKPGEPVDFHMGKRYLGHRPGVRADELFRAFDADVVAATTKYGGKRFVVRGVVSGKEQRSITLSGSAVPLASAPGRTGRRLPEISDLTGVKPDVTLTAEQLIEELKGGYDAAAPKYKGKVLEATGTVESFYADASMSAIFGAGGATFQTLEYEPWSIVAPGQQVTVRGRWPEGGQRLFDCVIVGKGPDTALAITAEMLAKEFSADKAAAEKRYAGKPLLVTGEVVSAVSDPEDWRTIRLAGHGATSVRFEIKPGFRERPEDEPMPRSKALVLARYDEGGYENGEVRLWDPHLIFGPR